MNKVIQFLISRFNLLAFVSLQIVCFSLIFTNNPYQSSAYFNSSNAIVGKILELSSSTKTYLELKEVNEKLATENAKLLGIIAQNRLQKDGTFNVATDSAYGKRYHFKLAKVINNSTSNFKNYLTINKGTNDSLAPGMGVICSNGIVGKIKTCSKNFSTVISVLNKDNLVSSKLKNSNAIGSIQWEGIDFTKAKLRYIPRHLHIKKGDTIVTSEFNAIYPEGILIGFIQDINIKGDDNFFNIDVKLSTAFSSLDYVYVIKDQLKPQLDSLENSSSISK